MFTINTNYVIKMNRGEDVQFPLFINNGTKLNPIRYTFENNDGCEVYFYLIPIHGSYEDFILKKTYTTDNHIVTESHEAIITKRVNTNINANKDIVITLEEEDTKNLCPGHYKYLVRAKVLTDKINSKNLVNNNEYSVLQVTNKYDFYLIDDDINRSE